MRIPLLSVDSQAPVSGCPLRCQFVQTESPTRSYTSRLHDLGSTLSAIFTTVQLSNLFPH